MTTVAAALEGGPAESPSDVTSVNARPPIATSETKVSASVRSDSAGRADSADFEAAAALPRVLKAVGAIVAPTTLLTALLFHFGLMYAVGYFHYFGVNWTVLDLPVQNYLILSVSSGIVPLVCAAGVMLLALWIYQLPLDALSIRAQRIALRVLMPSTAVAGLFLLTVGWVDVWNPIFGTQFPLEGRGLSLSIGILLLAYAARLRRTLTAKRRSAQASRRVPVGMVVAKWGAIFIVFSVGLFWAVSSYAINAGRTEAQDLEADLSCETDVTLYSEKSLNLYAPGVRGTTEQTPDSAYGFRYEHLKLVPQSGNMYLFLPAGWTHEKGAAILLPRSEKLRLEFSQPAGAQDGTC
jgi:hypothetical protein